jgi:hypothetical protein
LAGYADRTVTLYFPDLGDEVYVTLRNPRTMPPSALKPKNLALDAQGQPVDEDAAELEVYEMFAKLVRDWCVYDATSDADDQPRLGLPATAELVQKLPASIITRITEELTRAVNPN